MPAALLGDWQAVIITGTTDAVAGTESAHAHQGGTTPRTYLVLSRGNGFIYESKAPDATNVYLKGSAASLPLTALVFF